MLALASQEAQYVLSSSLSEFFGVPWLRESFALILLKKFHCTKKAPEGAMVNQNGSSSGGSPPTSRSNNRSSSSASG